MAETANIADLAVKVSDEIFKKFKWERIPLMDENFTCVKGKKHSKKANHTHPVDVVFKYFDPYLKKDVLLNTDLKSYKKTSISTDSVRTALKSLAHTISCAKVSEEWRGKYVIEETSPYEIRGLLFVYNHDEEYDKSFENNFEGLNIANLPIDKNQIIHILEPTLIRYLYAVINDMNNLYTNDKMPKTNYSFYYPDLQLHKAHGDSKNLPATIETITAPYMIIHFNEVTKYIEETESIKKVAGEGYVIFYNQDGSTHEEFLYLLDTLSRFQILNSNATIDIRVLNPDPSRNINSNFSRAKQKYISAWDFDDYKKAQLERIQFGVVIFTTKKFLSENAGWRVSV